MEHFLDRVERLGYSHPWILVIEFGGRAAACLNLERDYARGLVSADLPSLWQWYETRKDTR